MQKSVEFNKKSYLFLHLSINFSDAYSAYNVLAILAHEMSHAFQHYYGFPTFSENELENEKFTDALVLYLGYGKIYKNGQKYKYGDHIGRLGYFNDNSLIEVDEIQRIRFIKEKPMREYKKIFIDLQNEAHELIKGLEMHIENMKNLMGNMSEKTLQQGVFIELKQKYIDTNFVKSCQQFVSNLTVHTEEDAKKRIKFVRDELAILMHDVNKVEEVVWSNHQIQ